MAQKVWNFPFTGAVQEVTLEPSKYKLECWGAQGGSSYGGKGGYATGIIDIKSDTTLYIYVGGRGEYKYSETSVRFQAGGWNGGGGARGENGAGGGASDIRFVKTTNPSNELLSRILVAGGGGGGYLKNSYYGGGAGCDGKRDNIPSNGKKGTDRAGGVGGSINYNGVFGIGGGYVTGSGQPTGGGAGWYGGGADSSGGGGGGSNYAFTTSSYKPTDYAPDEKYLLTDVQLIDGESSMPTTNGGTAIGREYDGYIRISKFLTNPMIEITSKNRTQMNLNVFTEIGTVTKVEIYVNNILKQTSTSGFDNITFTFDVSDNTYVLGDNEIKIIAYDEVNDLSTTHLENYKNIIEPPVIPDNPSLKELIDMFDGVDSCMNYQLVELSNQLNNKGVEANVDEGMTKLVNKVKNINTGKRWASGISTRSTTIRTFYRIDTNTGIGASNETDYYLLIEGLDFNPSCVVSYVEYNNKILFNFSCNIKELYNNSNFALGVIENSLYSFYCYNEKRETGAYIVDNSFLIPIPINSSSVKVRWYAYE